MTKVRAKLSSKNKYWISEHRYYELKHFCLQYPQWKKDYNDLDDKALRSSSIIKNQSDTKSPVDLICKCAIEKTYYSDKIDIIEKSAKDADAELYKYLLTGITEGRSYDYLKFRYDIPCGKDMYYDRYRRFFWILSNKKK